MNQGWLDGQTDALLPASVTGMLLQGGHCRTGTTFSLMNCQMIRVISSPSISTTGLETLILLSASGTQHTQLMSLPAKPTPHQPALQRLSLPSPFCSSNSSILPAWGALESQQEWPGGSSQEDVHSTASQGPI